MEKIFQDIVRDLYQEGRIRGLEESLALYDFCDIRRAPFRACLLMRVEKLNEKFQEESKHEKTKGKSA